MNNSPSNIFLNITFVRDISPKLSDGFICYMHQWVASRCSYVPMKTARLSTISRTAPMIRYLELDHDFITEIMLYLIHLALFCDKRCQQAL